MFSHWVIVKTLFPPMQAVTKTSNPLQNVLNVLGRLKELRNERSNSQTGD